MSFKRAFIACSERHLAAGILEKLLFGSSRADNDDRFCLRLPLLLVRFAGHDHATCPCSIVMLLLGDILRPSEILSFCADTESQMAALGSSAPLKLHAITLAPLSHGGYHVSYSGSIPGETRLLLGIPDSNNAIDITHQKHHHLVDEANLGKFLALIGNAHLWGTQGSCRLYFKNGNSTSNASNEVTFDCPVKPLVCRPRLGGPSLGIPPSELMNLTYAAENAHGDFGRFLHADAIDGCVYFRNGKTGLLETSNDKRGLVCTTYIGGVWALSATPGGAMTWTGVDIATCSGPPFACADTGLQETSIKEVKSFLEQHKSETFLVGSHSHIVLAVRGVVHEFTTNPRSGYNKRSLENWTPHPHTSLWSVGKPALQFGNL